LSTPDPTAVVDWQAAFAEHERWLRTVVYARLRSADEVDEVLQEVALAAVRQAAPLQDPRKVAPWLYRLALRQALLYRRRCGRRQRLKDRYARRAAESTGPSQLDPLSWLLVDERRAAVRKALQRLNRGDAEMLLLKYTEQWSYREIAERLGVSESAVQARLHRARCRMRRELAALNLVEVKS
jgi:RNA polymerase sigma-70 factor (ECF subfamily)